MILVLKYVYLLEEEGTFIKILHILTIDTLKWT